MKSLAELFEKCLHAHYVSTQGGVDYAVEREADGVYIYLEDSDGEGDWKINLSFFPVPYKREGQTVFWTHRGFLSAFLEILPHIEPEIKDKRNRRFTVVGYSHGGALALLLHEHILIRRPELSGRVHTYAFGAPRVFWGKMSKMQKERFRDLTRIKNIDDLITHLPPRLFGFFHVGKLLTVGTRGKYSKIDAHRPENIKAELRLAEEKTVRFQPSEPLLGQAAQCTKNADKNYPF